MEYGPSDQSLLDDAHVLTARPFFRAGPPIPTAVAVERVQRPEQLRARPEPQSAVRRDPEDARVRQPAAVGCLLVQRVDPARVHLPGAQAREVAGQPPLQGLLVGQHLAPAEYPFEPEEVVDGDRQVPDLLGPGDAGQVVPAAEPVPDALLQDDEVVAQTPLEGLRGRLRTEPACGYRGGGLQIQVGGPGRGARGEEAGL
ncbi:hypothetical protein PG988_013795 [Apiospora saccharicola]